MDHRFDNCWSVSFLSTLLEQLDLDVRHRQVQSSPQACVLLGWHNVKIFVVRPSERSQFYDGVDNSGRDLYYNHRISLIPMLPVFSSYSYLAVNSR